MRSFAHFDPRRVGAVDVGGIVDGLGRLGIGVTHPVAELVVQNIAGLGSTLVTLADFVKYVTQGGFAR